MVALFNEHRALDVATRYINLLEKTGYVKPALVKKFVLYLFLIDFLDYTHMYFGEDEYTMVSKMLGTLFTNGGCLLPYPVFCTNRAILGRNEYMGPLKPRITEVEEEHRYTEDDYIRTV